MSEFFDLLSAAHSFWHVSSTNRYTYQTGWSINSEMGAPLISDLKKKKKKSYRKYCELWSIISDTLASNQDILKSGKVCSAFFCVCPPGVESTEVSLCLFLSG